MKKVLPIILYSIVILIAGGLLVYYGLVVKTLESGDLIKGLLVIAAALIGMLRPRRSRSVISRKAAYQKAYAEHIENAFSNDRKLERKLYRHYKKAIAQYEAAIQIHPNSSLYSNMGLCYQRLGQADPAVSCYQKAISLDSTNAVAHNNLASHYFRQGDYTEALRCSKDAIAINAKMHQALSCAAVCCALLGDETEYKKYYRQAVAAGYDGNTIKNTITRLNPNL